MPRDRLRYCFWRMVSYDNQVVIFSQDPRSVMSIWIELETVPSNSLESGWAFCDPRWQSTKGFKLTADGLSRPMLKPDQTAAGLWKIPRLWPAFHQVSAKSEFSAYHFDLTPVFTCKFYIWINFLAIHRFFLTFNIIFCKLSKRSCVFFYLRIRTQI